MTCQDLRERGLYFAVDDAELGREVECHLASCDGCGQWSRRHADLLALYAPTVNGPSPELRVRKRSRRLLAAAASVLLALSTGVFWAVHRGVAPPTAPVLRGSWDEPSAAIVHLRHLDEEEGGADALEERIQALRAAIARAGPHMDPHAF